MGLETGTYISDLNANNPVNATDVVGEGDDHLRLIKALLLNTFPNITGAVTVSHHLLNLLTGASGNIQDQLDALGVDISDLDGDTAEALALKADDNTVVKLAGTQEITGVKQFPSIELGHASDTTLARVAAGRVSVEGAELARLTAAQAFTAAQQFPSIELGHASDTTLTRIAAGRVAIEGDEIGKLGSSQTWTGVNTYDSNGAAFQEWARGTNGADEKRWQWRHNTPGIFFRAATDAGAAGHTALNITRSGSDVPAVFLFAANSAQLGTQDHATAPATTGGRVRHADGALYDVGMNVMPWVSQSSNVTISRSHVGTLMQNATGTPSYTTPSSVDTSVPIGAVINILNRAAGDMTVVPGSGVTMEFFDGTGAPLTGTRTISRGGVMTLCRAAADIWRCWGNAGVS